MKLQRLFQLIIAKQKKWQKNKNKDNGFSFMESLISLAVISIITLCISNGIIMSMRAYNKNKTIASNSCTLLQVDKQLREIITSIQNPLEINKEDITYSDHTLSVKWYKSENSIKTFEFNDIDILEIKMIKKSFKNIGVNILYSYIKEKYNCICLFSHLPYGEVEL